MPDRFFWLHVLAVPEDVGRDLPPGELLPLGETSWIPASSARRSMVRSTVLVHRCPELRPGKSHSWLRPAAKATVHDAACLFDGSLVPARAQVPAERTRAGACGRSVASPHEYVCARVNTAN
jgi:hypothetical protein